MCITHTAISTERAHRDPGDITAILALRSGCFQCDDFVWDSVYTIAVQIWELWCQVKAPSFAYFSKHRTLNRDTSHVKHAGYDRVHKWTSNAVTWSTPTVYILVCFSPSCSIHSVPSFLSSSVFQLKIVLRLFEHVFYPFNVPNCNLNKRGWTANHSFKFLIPTYYELAAYTSIINTEYLLRMTHIIRE